MCGGDILLGLILMAASAGAGPQAAPSATANLEGRILDESGQGLAGAVVSVSHPSLLVAARTSMTDDAGRFAIRDLPPGEGYSMRASLSGRTTVIAGPVRLESGRSTRLDLTLGLSSDLEETITVEATGQVVDTASTSTGVTYGTEFIEGLPLVGRRFSDLLTLAPGVTDIDGDGSPNVRGARDTGLQVRLDATNVTNPLTGKSGGGVNLEAVQELEIITAGAPAEFGRAEGGFANIITKSGSNETTGSVKAFFRSDFLDGDGANRRNRPLLDFNSTDLYATLGGPFVRDRLWYFATVERLEVEEPVVFPGGGFGLRGAEGWRGFGKLTWQRGTDHRLSVQLNVDPIESFGNNIGPVVSPEADYLTRSKGTLPQFNWNAILSPFLLLQFTLSHLDADLEIEPVSRHFRPIEVSRIDQGNQFVVRLPCLTVNCQGDASIPREARGAGSFITAGSGQEAGPYRTEADQDLDRSTLKSDLSWSLEGRRGRHAIKGGFEFVVERYAERGLDNPVLTDFTCPVEQCGVPTGTVPPPGVRLGTLALEVFEPLRYERTAAGFNAGAYVQDTWRPIPQLALNLGLRFDHEAVEAIERESFEPAREARDVLRRFDLVCDAVGTSCTGSRDPGRPVGPLPSSVTPPPGHPALELDLDDDGVLDLGGPEGALVFAPLTRPEGRGLEPFVIANANVSPRLSVSWDPWSDGRTKLFGSYGRYYDRLFLGTVTTGQLPESYSAEWNLGVLLSQQAAPGSLSKPLRGVLSSHQTDRNLSTPFTVEWTAGLEREIAPEWALAATWVKRRGVDLLQDIDVNHITCKGFDTTFGVDPMDVCGDAGRLELDRFGGLVLGTSPQGTQAGFSVPNGAIDQYVLNRNYSRILRVTNANGSDYVSFDLSLRRRQHRNWQMLLAYTWSRARGEAEAFVDIEGNDPAVSDDVKGFLDYDQRHVLRFQTAATLPHNLVAGASLEWASGLPFTFISEVSDVDDVGTLTPQRIFSLTGEKNDQRNRAWLTLNARLEKRFDFGRTTLGAFLEGGNLLDDDDLRLLQIDRDRRGAIDGFRRFGRRWQVGVAAHF